MKSLSPLLNAISANKTNLNIKTISDELLTFAIDSGMAAYLSYCSKDNETSKHFERNNTLKAADLTAKMITHVQLQALNNLLEVALPVINEIILLKGICICQNYYPQPHMRIMSDIDVLVSGKDSEQLKIILLEMGYTQKSEYSEAFYLSHHHSMPFYNKENNVWIEVHSHLFSGSNPALHDSLFDINNIFEHSIPMHKERYSNKVKQLNPELQLIYICTHWADELKINKACVQLVDMILLIKNNQKGIDWDKLFILANNTASASYLYLILSYFEKTQIIEIPTNYAKSFQLKYKNMGYLNKLILHKIISYYILGEKTCNKLINENNLKIIWSTLLQPSSSFCNIVKTPWNILFPPEEKERYKLYFLFNRLKTLLS